MKSLKRAAWLYPEWWTAGLSLGAWAMMLTQHRHHHHAGAWIDGARQWLLMVAAMMFPLVLGSVRTAAERSLWERRHRAIAGFLLGYLGTWCLVGAAVLWVPAAIGVDAGAGAAIGFGLAVLWQFTPAKRRSLKACHRSMPLAPYGWQADVACVRFGWSIGRTCVVSCWALMLACALAGHNAAAMVAATAWGAGERYGSGWLDRF